VDAPPSRDDAQVSVSVHAHFLLQSARTGREADRIVALELPVLPQILWLKESGLRQDDLQHDHANSGEWIYVVAC